MAVVINTTLKADTKDAVKQVEILKKEVEKVGKAAKKSGEDISAAMQIGNEATRSLDKVSGGLASKLVKVAKAAKLSGKAMKTALISSGIGAAVVALGLIVEYWDDISEAIGLTNKDLERHNELLELGSGVLDEEAAYYKERKKVLINSGQDISKINKEIAENEAKQLKNLDERIVNQRAIFDKANKAYSANRNEETRQAVVDAKKLAFALMTEREKIRNQKLEESTVVIDTKIRENEKRIALEAEKTKAAALERIRKGLIDTEAEERAEKLRLIQQDYDEQITLAVKYYGKESDKVKELKAAAKVAELAQQKVFDDKDKAKQDKINQEAIDKEKKRLEDIQKIVNDATELSDLEKLENERLAAQEELKLLDSTWIEKARINAFYMQQIADKEKEISDEKLDNDTKIADAKTDLQNKLVGNVQNAVGAIGNIFEKGTAASKGAALAEIAIGTGIGFINALDIAQKGAKASGPAAPFAFPIFYASQIAAVLGAVSQAKNILSTVKGGGGSGSTPTAPSGGGSAPQPPAFNIVGASGETQLADAIGGQTQRPARAYVVSNDVTTAQEMDRNIIEGASIG
jgi:hypothetical protein